MSAGDQAVKQAAARRAAKMAARHGVEVAPFEESDQLLWNKFGGNVDQMVRTIAYYDEDDDQIVINHAHEAWANMRRYVQDPRRKGWYSSRSPHHIIRHQIGHALHFRSLSHARRSEFW
jgi:hypothetical protein